ncbi:phage baseplate protein [Swingsia samuiensis]|uniref:Dit-like phage tail protein N-terminal domain-containing protein n=1 Tax=Swingsia samuiensis TaxID=1293412 RepID=A0A4Y6UMZ1_9PROT|nr:hypothetical protein [Swingsia samuiensis]QDH17405.1 hypothetical protein E3D00_07380 [Swingsia samuiensis]
MPFPVIPLPDVWDVPVAVGVPAVLGQSIEQGVRASVSTTAGKVLENWLVHQASQHWGIFAKQRIGNTDGVRKVLSSGHVASVDFGSQHSVATAPLENGAFTAYNKIAQPYNAVIEMVCDGTETGDDSILQRLKSLTSQGTSILGSDDILNGVMSVLGGGRFDQGISVRKSFLDTLDALSKNTELYQVVTPEKTYENANITGYRFRRDSRSGITMIVAEIAIQEIRQTATAEYKNTKEPAGADTVQRGSVQTIEPPSTIRNAF